MILILYYLFKNHSDVKVWIANGWILPGYFSSDIHGQITIPVCFTAEYQNTIVYYRSYHWDGLHSTGLSCLVFIIKLPWHNITFWLKNSRNKFCDKPKSTVLHSFLIFVITSFYSSSPLNYRAHTPIRKQIISSKSKTSLSKYVFQWPT